MCRRYEKTKFSGRIGMTLVELLVAMTIMLMVVGTIGILTKTVQSTSEYSESATMTLQTGRVCAERITRLVNEAVANQNFPGVLVLSESKGGWSFPDTLVIWHPEGSAANLNGMPLFRELVVICPDESEPNMLVEMTSPNDSRVVPSVEDTANWLVEIQALKTSTQSTWNMLTDMVREDSVSSDSRGAVRFEARQCPSVAQRQDYESGSLAWESVDWVQGVVGTNRGLCQTNLRFEIQLIPQTASGMTVQGNAIPIFGSAAIYYSFKR